MNKTSKIIIVIFFIFNVLIAAYFLKFKNNENVNNHTDIQDLIADKQNGVTNSQYLDFNGDHTFVVQDNLECGKTRKVTTADGYYIEQTITNKYKKKIDCIVTTALLDDNLNPLGDKSVVICNFEPGSSETITLKVSYEQYTKLTDYKSSSMLIEQEGLHCSTSTKVYEYLGQKYSDLAIYNNLGKTYSGDITITVKTPDDNQIVFEKTIHVDNMADGELREFQVERETDLSTDEPQLYMQWTTR